MKRFLLILTAVCLLLGLAACRTDKPVSGKPTEPAAETFDSDTQPAHPETLPAETQSAGTQPAETRPAETESAETQSAGTESIDTEPAETEPKPFEPITLVDDDACTARIVSMEEDDVWGFRVKFSLENKTGSTLLFSAYNCTIQGYFVEPGWIQQVGSGETKESELNVFPNVYEKCGFSHVEEFKFHLRAKDWNSYGVPSVLDEEFTLYPTGKTAEEIDHSRRAPQEKDLTFTGDDRFSVTITNVDPNGFWGYTLELFIENNTDQPLTFSWKEVKINGKEVEPWWIAEMPAGLWGYTDFSVSKEILEENGIENPTDFDFLLHVYNSETYEDLFAEHCAVVIQEG